MPDVRLTKTRIAHGFWEGLLLNEGDTPIEPNLEVLLLGEVIEGVEVAPNGSDNSWTVRVPIPAEVLSDGVQTFLIQDATSQQKLDSFVIVTGEPAEDDIRAEIDLLRAELDMLKAAFRRHCLEVQGRR